MARRRFDQNNNRVDYGELLRADADYELDQAVGMTYSLDMEALMGIPLCLGMQGEMMSGQRNNPLYVLEAIRRTGKKLSIFCNAGGIKVPARESRLFALLEDSIHEVKMQDFHFNFHPKVWVIQYHNKTDGRILIKVVVLSRNLTFDQSLDIALEITGFVGDKVNPRNKQLVDLLQFVSQFDPDRNRYGKLMANLSKVTDFELPDCFEDYRFHAFGIYGRSENGVKRIPYSETERGAKELFCNCYAILIVSPFLSEGVVRDILDDRDGQYTCGPTRRCLITRESSVTKSICDGFQKNYGDGVWIIDPCIASNDALGDSDIFETVNRDIHAKIYYTEKYGEPHKLYLGSLNASNNAFYHNVEFLIELSYKDYHSSYFSVRDDFLPEKESAFIPLSSVSADQNPADENVVDFREEIYGVESAEVINDEGKYHIKIRCVHDFPGVMIRPFFVKTVLQPLAKEVVFTEVELNDLSNLFVLSKEGHECLIRLEVTGIPKQEREDAIYDKIISDRPMLMAYMRYLLDEDFYDSVSLEELLMQKDGAEGAEAYDFSVELDIYERMLRAAAQYPQRFEAMYDVVKRLDEKKTGDEFRQLLEMFMSATGIRGKGRE